MVSILPSCTGRQAYINNKSTRQWRKYVDAPAPTVNSWSAPTMQQFPPLHHRRQQVNYADLTNTAPVYNQSSYTNNINPIPQTNNNQQSDKFNPSELFGIFNQMIDVVQQCKSKGKQLKALSQIICQYLI